MHYPVITISREYGSGGRAIGERLAKELGVPFYDKELIFMAAKESGLSEEYIKKTEQMKSTSFLYGLYMSAQQLPMNDQIFLVQSKIIRQVAQEGPCVIVGRCAAEVLAKQGIPCLNVFIHAPLDERVARLRTRHDITEADARRFIRKNDKARANYHKKYAYTKWGDTRNYHMTISSSLGIDKVARIIAETVK